MSKKTVILILLLCVANIIWADDKAPAPPLEKPTRQELYYKKLYQQEHRKFIASQHQLLQLDDILTQQDLDKTEADIQALIKQKTDKKDPEPTSGTTILESSRQKGKGRS